MMICVYTAVKCLPYDAGYAASRGDARLKSGGDFGMGRMKGHVDRRLAQVSQDRDRNTAPRRWSSSASGPRRALRASMTVTVFC